MPIKPTCDKCGEELQDFGGILLSPPDSKGMVKKFHLCIKCYEKMSAELKTSLNKSA